MWFHCIMETCLHNFTTFSYIYKSTHQWFNICLINNKLFRCKWLLICLLLANKKFRSIQQKAVLNINIATSYCRIITIDRLRLPRVTNVSPLAQSTPNSAQMSPANTSWTSWFQCKAILICYLLIHGTIIGLKIALLPNWFL